MGANAKHAPPNGGIATNTTNPAGGQQIPLIKGAYPYNFWEECVTCFNSEALRAAQAREYGRMQVLQNYSRDVLVNQLKGEVLTQTGGIGDALLTRSAGT